MKQTRFIDSVTLHLFAGHGGAGASSFRREKFAALGGPDGGDGGNGGNVVFIADPNIGTLIELRYQKYLRAEKGQNGGTKKCFGRRGKDIEVRVPVGTIVRDAQSLDVIADLNEPHLRHILAKGGQGGRGNVHFKTAVRQAPSYAQPGKPGEEKMVSLELKLLADIGIIGFPSVGKSTLISVISNAKPKIADYPFTTLIPNLGIVRFSSEKWGESFVVADIPGLIAGASEGLGLGFQFLRHVERCRALLHVIEITPSWDGMIDDGRDPIADFEAINTELRLFSPDLAKRPQIVALGKMDLPFVREKEPALRAYFEKNGFTFLSFSAAISKDLTPLLHAMNHLYKTTPLPDPAKFTMPEAIMPEANSEVEVSSDEQDQ